MKCFKFFILHSSFFILHGLLLLSISLKSQNLVPNWSFEDTVHCPGIPSDITNAQHWYSPNLCTPDYYNACSYWFNVPGGNFGVFQYAKQGHAYAGIFTWGNIVDSRDYIQVELTDSLIKDKWYCAGFWISKHEICSFAVRNIGMYVSNNPVGSNDYAYLPYLPQIKYYGTEYLTDTVNWVLISGSFQAQGGEKYITIGNFDNDANTDTLYIHLNNQADIKRSYYIIDAVFLYDCSESVQAYAGEDASICDDETAQLGTAPINGCHYKWTPNTGLDNDTLANPVAKPTQTTTYCLTMTDPYYQITTDTVIVEVTNDCNKIDFIPNIFTPNGDGHNEVFRVRGESITSLKLLVYNRWGNLVFEGNSPDASWDGKYKGQDCAAGVYYYVAEVTFKNGTTDNRNGCVTLIR